MSRAILQVMIRGRVQGVGYRAWVEYQAAASGLEGWVRNRRDGSVEAVFAGPPARVADDCPRRTGACRTPTRASALVITGRKRRV